MSVEMETNKNGIRILFLVFGLFYLTEGKACPEKTRPHKTRCELYYKCIEVPTRNHVWVPEKCNKGLVYIHNLKMCALPGDDWECTLGEPLINATIGGHQKKNGSQSESKHSNKDSDIYIVTNDDAESSLNEHLDEDKVEVILKSNIGKAEESDEDSAPYESSGDGLDLMDGFLQPANRETFDHMQDIQEIHVEDRPSDNHSSSSNSIDPNLTAHLQRLSQLIDGLKQTYQNRDKPQTELGPDQLNAFLAHFNIKSKFDAMDPSVADTTTVPTLPSTAVVHNDSTESNNLNQTYNKTKLRNQINNTLEPETKVVLVNSLPKQYSSTGYSNSQIVVNRPEGSVVFRLPPYNSMEYGQNVPKISEETLKTVLELSKQMIANQNVPHVIPNPAYYSQPIIQPLFLSPSAYAPTVQRPTQIGSPFSSYYGNTNSGNTDYENQSGEYNRPSIPRPMYSKPQGHKKPPKTHNNYGGSPGTTIIHNNVIPVHVTSTNSGEKEIIDSYGQSLGLYPPHGITSNLNNNNNNNEYTYQVTHQYENNKFVTTVRPLISTTAPNHYGVRPSPYPIDNGVTTARPPLEYQPTPSTVQQYYTPSPHLSNNNVNSIFSTTDHLGNVQYDSFPIDPQRPDSYHNGYQQVERPSSYSTSNQNSLFPPQIDPNKVKIYPNAEKIESMESEDDGIDRHFSVFNIGHHGHKKPQSSTSSQYGQLSANGEDLTSSSYSNNEYQNSYHPRPQAAYGNSFIQGPTKPQYPNYGDTQLVNIGGNFISYDAFQNTLLPLMGQTGNTDNTLNNIEVISCQAGIRQPNVTDCTRYYVCSKKDGKVLSYSCPPYTAFNGQTRICDARTYALCTPSAIVSSYTVSENKRLQLEALQAINEAKRRRADTIKVQNIANLLQQYNSQLTTQPHYVPQSNFGADNDNKDALNSYVQQATALTASASVVSSTTPKPLKKRKYYCKEGDKVPDQTSIYNYFVCYKNAGGTMKGHRMTCSKGLLFCPMTKMCTLSSKCA